VLVLIGKSRSGVGDWNRMRGGAGDVGRANAAVPKLTVLGAQLVLHEAEVERRNQITDSQRDQQKCAQNPENQPNLA
jgi:hypothetical protein